jgi:hypothetical protein
MELAISSDDRHVRVSNYAGNVLLGRKNRLLQSASKSSSIPAMRNSFWVKEDFKTVIQTIVTIVVKLSLF